MKTRHEIVSVGEDLTKRVRTIIGIFIKNHSGVLLWLTSFWGIFLLFIFLPQLILDLDEPLGLEWHLVGCLVSALLLGVSILLTRLNSVPNAAENRDVQGISETEPGFLQYLLSNHSSAPHVIRTLQEYHPKLPSLETYFSWLKRPDLLDDAVLKKSINATSSHELKACANPAFIRRLLKLCEATNIDLGLQTLDKVNLAEALVGAKTGPIDQALEEKLTDGSESLVSEILKGLQNSNRPVQDLIRFFRQVKQPCQNDLSIMLSAFVGRKWDLPEYSQDIQDLLKKSIQKRGGALINELDSHDDRTRLLELGRYISARSPEFAKWFIYKELVFVQGNLLQEFFPTLREIAAGLSARRLISYRSKYSSQLKQVVEHNWSDPQIEQLLKRQDENFKRALSLAWPLEKADVDNKPLREGDVAAVDHG